MLSTQTQTFPFFEALDLDDIRAAFPMVDAYVQEGGYQRWLDNYLRGSGIYYRVRLRQHYNAVRKAFVRQYGTEPADNEDDDTFERYLDSAGFTAHEDACEYARANADMLWSWLRADGRDEPRSISEVLEEMRAHLRVGQMTVFQFVKVLNAHWFNGVIADDPTTAKALRAVPYNEYLQTDHWLRIRAAMLILNGAHCQGAQCKASDSWWYDEGGLHVHHMTYANRGRERYDDLRLLCHRCHGLIHERGTAFVLDSAVKP